MKLSGVTVKVVSEIENSDNGQREVERSESRAEGFLHIYDSGEMLVTYAESTDGGRVDTEISVKGKTVTVSRKGAIESKMVFAEGETNTSLYSIPPYRFDAEVTAQRVAAQVLGDKARIELNYTMRIGGAERLAAMKIWILPNSSLA